MLAPSSVSRLSANSALLLPVFNKFKSQAKLGYDDISLNPEDEEILNTNETNEPVDSVKSLEIRSAMMRRSNGSNSDGQSIGSIRLEGDLTEKEGKSSQPADNLYKKSLLRRLGSHHMPGSSGTSGGFLTPRQGKVSLFGRRDSVDSFNSFTSRNTPDDDPLNLMNPSLRFRTISKDRPTQQTQSPLARQASLFASKPFQRGESGSKDDSD